MCKTRATLDFHGIWVQLRCNFTQCAQSRLQFKRVCTCNWKHYCHIDAIKIWYSWITIWNTLFFFLLSCSSSVLMVFLLIRNRQFRCQPFFFSPKSRGSEPLQSHSRNLRWRGCRLPWGGRHWGDAIFLGGKTTLCMLLWVMNGARDDVYNFPRKWRANKNPQKPQNHRVAKSQDCWRSKVRWDLFGRRPVAAEGWDFWRLVFFV